MEDKVVDFRTDFPMWEEGMKKTHKILIPNMLPWHFALIEEVLRLEGYQVEILQNSSRAVIDEGLKHVHNDTCYPCLCVVGQYIDALKSGKYDPEKTAVLITQSGGGCRASNYIPLIRKALRAEFPKVPVLSVNFSGLEKGSALPMPFKRILMLAFSIFYGDNIMWCYNQVKPYEMKEGDADSARDRCMQMVMTAFREGKHFKYKKLTKAIIEEFAKIPKSRIRKVKVGIVGEIYIKYSPLGNNELEKFLLKEDCEPVVPALMDFILYCIVNNMNDRKLYGHGGIINRLSKPLYHLLHRMQKNMIRIYQKNGCFEPLHDFEHLRKCADEVLNQGVKMGEGWLISAEMAALAESGTMNIVCAQPFGCLPNHVAGKGVARTIKNKYPKSNIVAVDYDPSATKVNQENRIKLMLATARENM